MGGSPGLVVLGGVSCSKGHEFESLHCILDGHFFTYLFVLKFYNVCLRGTKINEKEAGVGPFLKTGQVPDAIGRVITLNTSGSEFKSSHW